MSIHQLNPYLVFNGTAEQAIRLYERALGAITEGPMRFGDAPGTTVAPENRNRVMHARLTLGAGVIMVSDSPANVPAATESNVHVCLHFNDLADMTAKFEALAQGGTVTMAIQDTFWGAKFGQLTDAVGVHWMFNCQIDHA